MKRKPEICFGFTMIVTATLMISCNKIDSGIALEKSDDQYIAMEVYTHSTIVDQIEYLQIGLHDEYLHPEIVARLHHDAFLMQKLSDTTLERSDTIFSYDEIPLVKESKSHTSILHDGTWQSTTEHLTPFESYTLKQLSENPPSEDIRIFKTVVQDGHIKMYNHIGELMADDIFPAESMRAFLDTMSVYVQLKQKGPIDEVQDIARCLRTGQQLPACKHFSKLSCGHVILESVLEQPPASINISARMSGVLKSRTELSEDMTKIMKFELFHGDYLIQRKTYSYNGKSSLYNFYHQNVVGENPETIESESLILNSQGFPVLHHTKEYFQRSQAYYYFKD